MPNSSQVCLIVGSAFLCWHASLVREQSDSKHSLSSSLITALRHHLRDTCRIRQIAYSVEFSSALCSILRLACFHGVKRLPKSRQGQSGKCENRFYAMTTAKPMKNATKGSAVKTTDDDNITL